jgi:DNA gyrase subunit A
VLPSPSLIRATKSFPSHATKKKDDPEEEVADNGTAEAGQSPAEPVNESNETAQSGENVNNVDEA